MKIVLFDGIGHRQLLPLTYTRPVAHLRVGILTLEEKWNAYFEEEVLLRTKDYLGDKFNSYGAQADIGIYAGLLPTDDLVDTIKELKDGQLLMKNGQVLAIRPLPDEKENMEKLLKGSEVLEYDLEVDCINRPWDIFRLNGKELEKDFEGITANRSSAPLDASNRVIGDRIFVEEGAIVSCAIINTTEGPVYIGKQAEIMEGALIRGGLALCDGATLKMGAKIYGPTTIGPYCKVGGEVGNSVFLGYSNKGHDGYVGNSVIGEWCNLGADTNTSNLKNNYGHVRVWSIADDSNMDTQLQFCGLTMGDHAKCSINTMFNTGTVVGVGANIFQSGFPDKFVPSFAWGGEPSAPRYALDKFLETAREVMKRRTIELTQQDVDILSNIYNR
jgi:UDP-N-acetylglucosamine diphosphorylase/glucosamine-1-phosphate N-acetyltransferase